LVELAERFALKYEVDVRSETTGLVISEPLRKGAFVQKGQLLCELDTGTRNAQLAEAKARLAEAEANNTAAASLSQKGYTSETAAIGRLAQLESAMAAVEQADFVPENGISRLTLGAAAGARLVTGEELQGFLTFLSRSADPQTRTFRVEVTVPNPDLTIRDGATAEIFVAFDGEKAHLLPQAALTLNDEGQLGIRAAVDDVARFLPVDIVRDTSEGILVSGLPESIDVIVVGQEYVIDGRAITVTMQETIQ